MDRTEQLNEDEWAEIRQLPLQIAAMISAVDYSALSEGKEYKAFATYLAKAAAKRHRSEFLADVLAELRDIDLPAFQDHCLAVTGALSGDKPVDRTLARAKQTAAIVDAKLPKKTAKSYKNFLMDVAVAVARAHKESLMPLGSPVSTTEDYHIRRLERSLGL